MRVPWFSQWFGIIHDCGKLKPGKMNSFMMMVQKMLLKFFAKTKRKMTEISKNENGDHH